MIDFGARDYIVGNLVHEGVEALVIFRALRPLEDGVQPAPENCGEVVAALRFLNMEGHAAVMRSLTRVGLCVAHAALQLDADLGAEAGQGPREPNGDSGPTT